MSESIRRRRRKKTDSTEVDLSIIAPTESSPPSAVTESDSDNTEDYPPTTVDTNTTSHQATIDRICSEINEDKYHSQHNEPEYSNDTHDWSDNFESASSDYCRVSARKIEL